MTSQEKQRQRVPSTFNDDRMPVKECTVAQSRYTVAICDVPPAEVSTSVPFMQPNSIKPAIRIAHYF